MARKKTEKPKMAATEVEAELRVVRLALPPDEHQQFRVLAAKEGTNMALLARRIVREYIAKNAVRVAGK